MPRTRTAKQNDILARFSELGHEALNRLSEVPGGSKVVEMMNETKARLDEMQKKLRGLDELEQRVAKLEKQVAAQAKSAAQTKSAAQAKSTTGSTRKPAAQKPATPKKPPA